MSSPAAATDALPAALTVQDCHAAMQDFMASLPMPHIEERSAKCRPGAWSEARWLMGAPVIALARDAWAQRLPPLLERLGMPLEDRRAFLAPLANEDEPIQYLHLGLEDAYCKAYWESPLPSRQVLKAGESPVLYQAWKWQPGKPAAVSDYRLAPSARHARVATHHHLEALPEVAGDLLEHIEIAFALAQVPWPPLTVEIEERLGTSRTPRHSLNLHLHTAGLPLGTLAGPLLALVREWRSAERATLQAWLAQHGADTLSNVSFGLGRDGQPFFTTYYGGRVVRPTSSTPTRSH